MIQEEREQIEKSIQNAQRRIFVRFQKEGIHCFPEAATNPALADVSFLGSPHRHIFHFCVWIDVNHTNREIEFIQFKRWVESLYTEGTLQLDYRSCEMMADDLYLAIAARYPGRSVHIEVSEDGENGCSVSYS